jgi:hypothetical protein
MAKRNDEEARTLSEVPIWRDTAEHRRRTGNTPLGSKSGEWGWGSYSPQRVQLTAEEDKTQRDHVRLDAHNECHTTPPTMAGQLKGSSDIVLQAGSLHRPRSHSALRERL